MPSKVQLVSDIILTRSSLPTRLSANSFDLISRSGTAPYMEYSVSGGLQIDDLGAGQHHAVVVRLMAVAVQQHDVAWGDQ